MNKNFIKNLANSINKDNIGQISAQCSYYTMLSFIPFTILLITLIQYTGIEPQTLFEFISKIIPDSINEIVVNIVQEVYSKSIGTISISIIFTIWSAGQGLFALTKGMQNIYKTTEEEKASYLYIFKGFSLTYGSLTTLMLIMMWTYLCFYIIFIGAELNKTIKNYK